MTDQTTARLALPLLQAGQAQKEVTHNEALTLLDLAVQPVVEAVGRNDPPAVPSPGMAWIVGAAPSGGWIGQARAVAGWTEGGWRFVAPNAGMSAWSQSDAALARFDGTDWVVGTLSGARLVLGGVPILAARQPAIAAPASGAVVDIEARSTLSAILFALRAHGLIGL